MAMAMAVLPSKIVLSHKIPSKSNQLGYGRLERLKLRVFSKLQKNQKPREFRLHSFSLMPLFTLAISSGVTTKPIYETFYTWTLSEEDIKSIYLIFAIIFCFGCCVAGSMNDPFYDSEEYRRDGGDGSVNWQYQKQEIEEREAREELWREELQRELEEKAASLKESEEAEVEKAEEFV